MKNITVKDIVKATGGFLLCGDEDTPITGLCIDSRKAQPGDLFFYGSGKGINHVAIYIGNGQIVHASSPSTGIKISNAYYRSPVCVVRVLGN